MTSDLGQIAQAKSAQAQNKINQFNQLANVSLKGLQANAMDEGVAARDNMIKQIAQWEATDGPMGLSWEHQKEAQAMKAGLEDMVTRSQQNQKLLQEHYQQALAIKDKKRQQQYLDAIQKASQGNIMQVNNNLSNITPPNVPYSLSKALSLYPTIAHNKKYFNVQDAANFYKGQYNSGQWDTVKSVEDYLKQNPNKTVDDAFNYMAQQKANTLPNLPTEAQKAYATAKAAAQGRKAAEQQMTLVPDQQGGNVISLYGADKKPISLGNYNYVDPTNPKAKVETLPNATLLQFKQDKNGNPVAVIAYSKTEQMKAPSDLSASSINIITGGGKIKGYYTKDIPASQLRNFIKQKGITFQDAPWMEPVLTGKPDSEVGKFLQSTFNTTSNAGQ